MTGADIIGELLHGYAPLTAKVPTARIKGGRLPEDTPLPALLVRTISSVEREYLRRGNASAMLDRVSVTVRAQSYDEQIKIMDLVVDACAPRVSVRPAGRGPDLTGPGDSFEQAQDFRVSFNRPNNRKE
ncbi:hypothetical protein KV697_10865 [Sphingomonas sanguinis]|uniref:hypothetical protein n=1 Tax=Sphingomonas sanguinis TaxID=33051 RepID=UPI001C564D4A|nr:hypothetical protein [Sphingomonas sanguinis]QXT34336.1 hypothetical protein KV697_10865 [Sphingomonas sanguinis]